MQPPPLVTGCSYRYTTSITVSYWNHSHSLPTRTVIWQRLGCWSMESIVKGFTAPTANINDSFRLFLSSMLTLIQPKGPNFFLSRITWKISLRQCCPYLGEMTYYEESLCRKVHLRWFSKNGACMSVNALLKLVLMPKKRNKNWTSCLYLGPPPSILSVTKLHFQPLTFRRFVGDFYRVL